ncbi:hypothetical protein GN956_G3710 [Arapaima gigas]
MHHFSKTELEYTYPTISDMVNPPVMTQTELTAPCAAELVEFVKGGGGLLIGGQAWHWAYTHKEDVLHSFPGNKITGVAGIYFTAIYGKKGSFPVPPKIPPQTVFVRAPKDLREDLKVLLDGVKHFDLSSSAVPSALLVHGPLAFPVAQDESGQVFLAAAHYGGGRVVVIPHEGYLNQPVLQRVILNAVHWLDTGRKGKIFVRPDIEYINLHKVLSSCNFDCRISALGPGASVYCCSSYSDAQAEEIHCFVAEGGGLLMAGHAWWWSYQHPGQNSFTCYPGNKILNRLGISILTSTVDQKLYNAPTVEEASTYSHFRQDLSEFIDKLKMQKPLKELRSLGASGRDRALLLAQYACHSCSNMSVFEQLVQAVNRSCVLKVSPKHPVRREEEKFLLHVADVLYSLNDGEISTRISVPSQQFQTVSIVHISIDATNEGDGKAWRSTGLYVCPGKRVTVCVQSNATEENLELQIGCHTDNLSGLSKLKRAPVVTRCFPVTAERLQVSSLWGGLLYVVVPAGCRLGSVEVIVEEAVRAPYFKLGVSRVAEWQSTGRHHPAPWAELEGHSVILTVPSENVRHLDDPTPLLTLWNHIMEAVARLAGCASPFVCPERIVTDVQISAECLYSSYPIMVHLESVTELTQVDHMRSVGLWDPIRELGCNQQKEMWEFRPHTTEATCDLWSVYVHETVLDIPRNRAHTQLKRKKREERIKAYINGGAKLENWSDWTCLETYLQLQEGFGWEAFIQLFSDYRSIQQSRMTKEEKMKLWAEKFSQVVKMNLILFFKAWDGHESSGIRRNLVRSCAPRTLQPLITNFPLRFPSVPTCQECQRAAVAQAPRKGREIEGRSTRRAMLKATGASGSHEGAKICEDTVKSSEHRRPPRLSVSKFPPAQRRPKLPAQRSFSPETRHKHLKTLWKVACKRRSEGSNVKAEEETRLLLYFLNLPAPVT